MIKVANAFFLLILKSHKLGDLLKIIFQKKLKKNYHSVAIKVANAVFCLFQSRVHWVIFSKLVHEKSQKNHHSVVIKVANAFFLLILKSRKLCDLLKVNLGENSTGIFSRKNF